MMNKLLSPPVLSFLVGVSAMASVILCVMHIQYNRRIRSIEGTQRQLVAVRQQQAKMRQLGTDLHAYSRTNAAIRPLLQSVTAKRPTP